MKKYNYACAVPLLQTELEQIDELSKKYESSKSSLMRRFLMEGLSDFEEKNQFSLNFSLEYMSDVKAEKKAIFYVSDDTAEKLKFYSSKTKLSIGNISRYFIVLRLERGDNL